MATGANQASHPLLRPEQAHLARQSLNSVFSVAVNLYHLLPGAQRTYAKIRREYYLRTHKVDPTLPKTPEDEAKLKAKEKQEEAKLKKKQEETKPKEEEEGRTRKRGRGPTSSVAAPPASTPASQRHQPQASQEPSQAPGEKGLKTSNRNGGERHSTGFAISQKGTTLRILTCAHTIDEVYGAGVHDISVADVNMYFSFDVHCSHQERKILTELNGKPINQQVRLTTQASVVALDTEKDLMVLEIDTENIFCGDGDEMCEEIHPTISMVGYDLTELEECILQGWPPQRMGSLSVGQLSFESRTYEAIAELNEKGYNMKLLEFTRLLGDEGSSGAPAINGLGQSLGVYHGDIGPGYVVSAKEVTQFLEKFDMLLDWSMDEDDQ